MFYLFCIYISNRRQINLNESNNQISMLIMIQDSTILQPITVACWSRGGRPGHPPWCRAPCRSRPCPYWRTACSAYSADCAPSATSPLCAAANPEKTSNPRVYQIIVRCRFVGRSARRFIHSSIRPFVQWYKKQRNIACNLKTSSV